jgi:hypothetical protein
MTARARFLLKSGAAMGCGLIVAGPTLLGAAWAFLGIHLAKRQADSEEVASATDRCMEIFAQHPEVLTKILGRKP